MAGLSYEFEGLEQFVEKVKKAPDELIKQVGAEIQASGVTIAGNAERRSPIRDGNLRAGISYHKVNDLEAEVDSNAEYSAFLEFGTSTLVFIPLKPDGVDAIALQAKGHGKNHGAIHPHPFLFNSLMDEVPFLIERVDKILKDIV